jgi:hypothetical protein
VTNLFVQNCVLCLKQVDDGLWIHGKCGCVCAGCIVTSSTLISQQLAAQQQFEVPYGDCAASCAEYLERATEPVEVIKEPEAFESVTASCEACGALVRAHAWNCPFDNSKGAF